MKHTLQSYAHKIGATFFVLWGALHIVGAGFLLLQASTSSQGSALATIGSGLAAQALPPPEQGLVAAIVAYYAWNLFWIGIFVLVVGASFNWRNSRSGYWLNMTVVGAVDIGLIYFLLLPGYMALSDGLLGVGLWLLAALFSAMGLLNHREPHATGTLEMTTG